MKKVFGSDRYIIIARELTKTFESCYRGTVEDVEGYLKNSPNECKGEFTIILSGRDGPRNSSVELERWLNYFVQAYGYKECEDCFNRIWGF